MALVAHRMMLPSRHRRSTTTQQQVARNKVGVLLVPSVADYYGGAGGAGGDQASATPLPTPAASQNNLNLHPELQAEPSDASSNNGKFAEGSQPDCFEFSKLAAPSSYNLEPAAFEEVAEGGTDRHQQVQMDALNKPAERRGNEIITQAALEHEVAKLHRFLAISNANRSIANQFIETKHS